MIAKDAVPTSHQKSSFRLSSMVRFSILAAISGAVWWKALIATLALALHNEQYTHILLIFPVSASSAVHGLDVA